jgi:hypothetical protein
MHREQVAAHTFHPHIQRQQRIIKTIACFSLMPLGKNVRLVNSTSEVKKKTFKEFMDSKHA